MADRADILLAEYENLKREQAQRIGFRDNFIYVNLAVIAIVGGTVAQSGQLVGLLAITPATAVLGWIYLMNDRMVTEMGAYIRDSLDTRLAAAVQSPSGPLFGWEHDRPDDRRRTTRKRVQLAVDLGTFCLPGLIAILVYSFTAAAADHLGFWTGVAVWFDALIASVLAWQIVSYSGSHAQARNTDSSKGQQP